MIQLTRCHFWQKVARYLPKKLLYYAYIKVVAEMTSGKFARVNVNDLKTMDVLKMFEDHHKLGHKYEKCWCHKFKV